MRICPLHIALLLILAASCSRNADDLQFRQVNFAISLPEGSAQEAMRMLLFDSASGRYAGDANLTGEMSGNVFSSSPTLRTGVYDTFCYGLDIPDTFVGIASDKSSLYFYTGQVTSDILARCGYDDGTPLFHTPDKVLCASFPELSVGGGPGSFSSAAQPLVETWTIEVKGNGLGYAQSAGTVISGFPTTCHPFNPAADASGELWTGLSISGDKLNGSFNVFKGDDAAVKSIVINVTDVKGKTYLYPLDCTELVAEARRSGSMRIVPEAAIELPEPDHTGSEGGFQPTLGEWNHQTGEIII